jgi:hypothetical protein
MMGRFLRSLYVGRMTEYLSFAAVFAGAIVAMVVTGNCGGGKVTCSGILVFEVRFQWSGRDGWEKERR